MRSLNRPTRFQHLIQRIPTPIKALLAPAQRTTNPFANHHPLLAHHQHWQGAIGEHLLGFAAQKQGT